MSCSISVIVSTYNSELWLNKVLIGFNNQTFRDFEILVADDGSDPKTRDLIKLIKPNLFYKIKHVWHPDNGFQKTIIFTLNFDEFSCFWMKKIKILTFFYFFQKLYFLIL